MKRHWVLGIGYWVVLAIGVGCSPQRNENAIFLERNDLSITQSGKYLLHAGKVFSGVLTERFENGELQSRSEYKDGLLEGTAETFYPNGRMESSRPYVKGEKNGTHRGWWPNGNLQFEYQFSQGLYHGTFREWYENGKPLHLFVYEHGKELKATGWRENGRTYINFVIRHGKKYGLTNARLCYSLEDEQGLYQSTKQ